MAAGAHTCPKERAGRTCHPFQERGSAEWRERSSAARAKDMNIMIRLAL